MIVPSWRGGAGLRYEEDEMEIPGKSDNIQISFSFSWAWLSTAILAIFICLKLSLLESSLRMYGRALRISSHQSHG